jgi:wyosine [tRNA(Phe)-imidazoG37] synthetase (radical SAM superfamily)
MTLPLLDRIVYGPVRSRRLGASLGINLLPAGMKICNMDCAYCQYGWTRGAARYRGQGTGWPAARTVEMAVAERLDRAAATGELIDRITIAGHGEPTLHPEFDEITERLCTLRDRVAPVLPIAVLSNSTTCMYEDVRNGLRRIDERCMKLDGGDAITLRHINGTRVPIATLVDGLVALGPLTVQSMFVTDATGRIDNSGDGAVNEWLAAIEHVRPINVQVYTLGRSPALASLQPVSTRRLREIAEHVRAAGIPAEVFGGGKPGIKGSAATGARRGPHVWKSAPAGPQP